ncbi:MAG: ribosome small subunit-dependent GTPase A [Clostridiales Family XIII bacterium]|jgi:ribosome biogenesis GTPase|nr:ribosome small subunit-dependent GTPase A [Clostridiales Family XIII bacterium]
MMEGLIIKGIGGFYYVRAEGGAIYQCRARGAFRKDGITPTVGDVVDFQILDDEEGVVHRIWPRKNIFVRPPVANVDCFIVMMAAACPAPNLEILDRFIVAAERANTEVIICLNKVDLSDPEDVRKISEIYRTCYTVEEVSCATGLGIDKLSRWLMGKRCALAGPSGVGKSTLLNIFQHDLKLETGEVSDKTKRGKHTTRHVELFLMEEFGAWVFDTPGFTSFETSGLTADELAFCYPDIWRYSRECRFSNCRHVYEPDCRVTKAVKEKEIAVSRYESYLRQLEEIGGGRY